MAEQITHLGDGSINSLVIHYGNREDLAALIRRTAENTGSLPGPAEYALNDVQARILRGAADRAVVKGQQACDKGLIPSYVLGRSGDAGQNMRVKFTCERSDEECCLRGLRGAVVSLRDEIAIAKTEVTENPLSQLTN